MAYAVKIVSENEDSSNAGIEVKWWNKQELLNEYNFTEHIDNGYLDHILTVSKDEFQKIFDGQEQYRDTGIYDDDEWKKINNKTKGYINERLKEMTETDKVNICIYEWESGY